MRFPLLSFVTAPLFKSLPSSVLSLAITTIIFVQPSSSSCQYISSSILLPATSTALLDAFLFWPYMCIKPVGLLPSVSNVFYHLPCFPLLPTAFATSSVHHYWFLFTSFPRRSTTQLPRHPNECIVALLPFTLHSSLLPV